MVNIFFPNGHVQGHNLDKRTSARTHCRSKSTCLPDPSVPLPFSVAFSFLVFSLSRETYVVIIIIHFKFTDKQNISCHRMQVKHIMASAILKWYTKHKNGKIEESEREQSIAFQKAREEKMERNVCARVYVLIVTLDMAIRENDGHH